MQHSISDMVALFNQIFNPEICNQMAKEHKFIQRSSSRIDGHEFIKTLILPSHTQAKDSLDGLCQRLKQFNSDLDISASALSQRINTPFAVELMKACMQNILQATRAKLVKQYSSLDGPLKLFKNIYIQDSTVFELNKHLHRYFKGTRRGGKKGGTTCKAQAKIDLIHNYTTGVITEAQIYEGKLPDQALTSKILDIIQEGDLVLRDLGYFKLEVFDSIAKMGGYYLTRFPSHVKVFLNQNDKLPVDLAIHFNKFYKNCPIIDIPVWIGEKRTPTRLVAYRVPKDVKTERLRKARKGAKEMGRTLSQAKLQLLDFSIFITNIPKEMLSAEIIGTIYRIRWEIELIFKHWKSLLNLDFIKGTNRYRVECLIWSRLCMVVLVASLSARFMNLANELLGRELSPTKLIEYLIREGSLIEAVRKNTLEEFIKNMVKDISKRLLKNKSATKTMREKAISFESYYGCAA